MYRASRIGVMTAAAGLSVIVAAAQPPVTIVRDVRAAVACTNWPCTPKQDLSGGDAVLKAYRAAHGTTSEALEALSWLGRAAVAGGQLDKAFAYASETYELATAALKQTRLEDDPRLETALGAAIEVQAQVRAGRGQRSDAVYFLGRELEKYHGTPLHRRIQKNVHLLSLEGQPAPALQDGAFLGRPMPTPAQLRGKPVLLFFWAHWCPDCKAQAPIVAKMLDRYGKNGLAIIAPTQRYGYTVRRTVRAAPDEERHHIEQVRDTSYPFLRNEPVPVSETNHTVYGVSTVPTLVLIDRLGVVRLYHPGNMTEKELGAAIDSLLGSTN
jgi:thiol-disulfide isomerase/thioredoxin